jgi:hypothetical protein
MCKSLGLATVVLIYAEATRMPTFAFARQAIRFSDIEDILIIPTKPFTLAIKKDSPKDIQKDLS